MNTLHSTSATLASINAADVYDSDGILREGPPLQPKTLKLCITPSPPPKVTEVSRSSPTSPSSSRRRSSNHRRKAKPSLGQTVLLQFMTGGRNPDIANFEPPDSSEDDEADDGEADEDDDDENGIPVPYEDELLEEKEDDRGGDDNDKHYSNSSTRQLEEDTRRASLSDAGPSKPGYWQLIQPGQRNAPLSNSDQGQRAQRGQQKVTVKAESHQGRAPSAGLDPRTGNDAMSLDEISRPPAALPPASAQQQERARSHDHERSQRQGQDHDRQSMRQHARSATENSRPSANQAAIASAAEGALAKPGRSIDSVSANLAARPLSASTATSSSELRSSSRSPKAKRDHNGMPKPATAGPGMLRLVSSGRSSQTEYSLAFASGVAIGSGGGGGGSSSNGSGSNQTRQQHQGGVAPLYTPHRDGSSASQQQPQESQQRQPDQCQLLTPASTITPREPLSASTMVFPPIKIRDDRSMTGSTASGTLATPSSTHSPNDYTSPFSPNNAGIAASPAAFSPRSQPDFHLSRQSTSNLLPPLPPMQRYTSPRPDINSVASSHSANSPINHASGDSMTGVVANSPASGNPTSSSDTSQKTLPPLLKHLTDSSLTGTDPRQPQHPAYIQPSPRFPQFPSIAHSHHSSPTSPDEIYRRGSEIASPAVSVSNVDGHPGNNRSLFYPPSARSSSYGGSRRGTEYGGDTPASEPQYSTPGSTGRPAVSPGRLLHPIVASSLPNTPAILPPPVVRHDHIAPRQPPTIESLTGTTAQRPLLHPQEQQQRLTLPPLHQSGQGPYQCEVEGCTAAPFPTQYLLNSHANVHSSNRPHYCPEPDCPRSKAGKGFKRKNEMIRHGLVHRSPGYVCPFCPDREHKYPRPDNLQRHVRVHHKDKERDDPLLRDVLAQRADGPSRGRRRRL